MSAIDKDREIAAKATVRGDWRVDMERDLAYFVDESHNTVGRAHDRDQAEHIVRLHNRQPLYDALVDAARAIRTTNNTVEFARNLQAIYDSIDALDSEDES